MSWHESEPLQIEFIVPAYGSLICTHMKYSCVELRIVSVNHQCVWFYFLSPRDIRSLNKLNLLSGQICLIILSNLKFWFKFDLFTSRVELKQVFIELNSSPSLSSLKFLHVNYTYILIVEPHLKNSQVQITVQVWFN